MAFCCTVLGLYRGQSLLCPVGNELCPSGDTKPFQFTCGFEESHSMNEYHCRTSLLKLPSAYLAQPLLWGNLIHHVQLVTTSPLECRWVESLEPWCVLLNLQCRILKNSVVFLHCLHFPKVYETAFLERFYLFLLTDFWSSENTNICRVGGLENKSK